MSTITRLTASTSLLTLAILLTTSTSAFAQYNTSAGKSVAPSMEKRRVKLTDSQGEVRYEEREVEVKRDSYGNASESSYDLAVDGAFEGQTIVVLQLYPFSFDQAREALARKGFSVYRFNSTPSPEALAKALEKANQFWLISNCDTQTTLTEEHVAPIKKFFDSGHGVYLWGDNDPCYVDVNYVSERLLDVKMTGNTPGDTKVGLKEKSSDTSGILANHLMSTGIETIYEGITIATIDKNDHLDPFLWGSAGNLVAALYDHDQKRAIFDGGFTRLYYKWDTAGTARYVVNAAAWLANYERFGDEVLAESFRDEAKEMEQQRNKNKEKQLDEKQKQNKLKKSSLMWKKRADQTEHLAEIHPQKINP